jgi:adenylate kinase
VYLSLFEKDVSTLIEPGDVIVIMGLAGAGKGEQSARMAERYSAEHISTGALMREQEDPEMVKIMNSGGLVPEWYFKKILKTAILKTPVNRTIILEGVTKKPDEVPWLLDLVESQGRRVNAVIVLEIDATTQKERTSGRGRADDDPAIQEERWRCWHEETSISIERYRQAGICMITLDGRRPIDVIAKELEVILDA